MRHRARRGLAALVAVSSLASGAEALAHDQWFEPDAQPLPLGATARVALKLGEAPDAEEEKAFERAKFTRLEVRSRNGPIDLLAATKEGAKPVVSLDGLGVGEFLVVADRAPVLIELEPKKFEAYLAEEGLDAIRNERATRGETDRPGRERYTRHMKGLIHVGAPVDHHLAETPLRQRLELLLEPSSASAPALAVRVLFEGQPLAGAHVQLSVRGRTEKQGLSGRTTADGRVRFVSAPSGFAIVHLVHMRRCLERDGRPCRDADWESAWASLSLVLP